MPPEAKPPASCAHEHLAFEDGSLHLRCIDCGRYWIGLVGKGGAVDYTLSSSPVYPPRHTRHDRWVVPRMEPLRKP
jgi:hypothetical protein